MVQSGVCVAAKNCCQGQGAANESDLFLLILTGTIIRDDLG